MPPSVLINPQRPMPLREGGRLLPASGSVLVRVGKLLRLPVAEDDDDRTKHASTSACLPSSTVTLSLCGRHVQTASAITSNTNDKANDNQWQVLAVPLAEAYHETIIVHVACTGSSDKDSAATTTTAIPTIATKTLWQGVQAVQDLPIHRTTTVQMELRPVVTSVATTNAHHNMTNPQIYQCQLSKYVLELEITVLGPYRPEIAKALQLGRTWLQVVDQVQGVLQTQVLPKIPKQKQVWLVAVPVAIASIGMPLTVLALLVSPMVIGISVLFFPIVLPLVIGAVLVLVASFIGMMAIIAGIYGSTKQGRKQVQQWYHSQSKLQQLWDTVSGPRFGVQTAIYNTGPRPTPVTLMRTQLPTTIWKRLAVSLLIDGVGSGSYLLPVIGESFDLVWAPTQTVLIMALYQHVSPNMSYISFAEEMLPFLDVLPTATTGWMMEFGPQLLDRVQHQYGDAQPYLWGNGGIKAGPAPVAVHG